MSRTTEVARSATVWIRSAGAGEAWAALELDGDAFALTAGPAASDGLTFAPLPEGSSVGAEPPVAVLVRGTATGGEEWCLLASTARLRVNGEIVLAGARVLQDRDEVLIRGARFAFSAERLARPEIFAAGGRVVCCARCGLPIEDGQPAVRCPARACSRWHHHRASPSDAEAVEPPRSESCWETAPACAACQAQPTALDVDLRWTPED